MSLLEDLKSLVTDGPERVGCITKDGIIKEFVNESMEPDESFIVGEAALKILEDEAVATWHTHPQGSPNLSGDDYIGFRSWPDLYHFILGNPGVKCYKYSRDKGAILENDPDHTARILEGADPSAS